MRVLVTQAIDPAGLAILRDAGLDVDERSGEAPIPRDELLARIAGCDAVIPMPTDRIDDEVLATGVRLVANHAVGTDNVDLAAARARGVVVTNTPGVLTDATADLAMALILAAARHVVAGDRLVREGRFLGWRPTMLRGLDLRGARLGIVGFGRIGRAVAERARAFGMEVVARTRTSGPVSSDGPDVRTASSARGAHTPSAGPSIVSAGAEEPAGAPGPSLDELLSTSDVVSLHCPLTPETRHLVGEAQLARMKRTAVLVNTARGPVVDEAALARALRDGVIAAAGLDVYEREPLVHPDLLDLDNVVLLPHLGSATWASRRAMAEKAARNVVAVLAGGRAIDPV